MMWRMVCLMMVCWIATAVEAQDLAILPGDFALKGAAARQTLVVEEVSGGKFVGEVGKDVSFTSSDEKVVKVEGGVAIPMGDGKAVVTAKAGTREAKVNVTVSDMGRPYAASFRNDVQPTLTKLGCNAGACHGALAGQNGFRLSLRGYDDSFDYNALTRHTLGRRFNPHEPAKSLFLLKPLGAVPHKGGTRMTVDSPDFGVLVEWIAAGVQGPKAEDARIQKIEVVPDQVVLRPGVEQQVLVQATYSDGSVRDVTRLAKFTSNDGSVAYVNDTGLIKVMGSGEGTLQAWFMSKLAVATISVPYGNTVAPEVFAKAPRRNLIDELILEKLAALNLPPSPRCTDGEFIRRAYLDTSGTLPTADEVRQFLADSSVDKRDKLIETLLSREEFVDYWAYKWSDLLLVSSKQLRSPAMWAYYRWVRSQVAANTPWDEFSRQVLTAKGSTLDFGATNFFVLHDDPTVLSETVSVAFLGMAINCAKCHNHPMEKWTNDQYYSMANLFARVRTKNIGGDGNHLVFADSTGDLIQPLTGKVQPPMPLDGQAMDVKSTADRREHFVKWLVARENPYFARAIVNRVWANYMTVGLVEKVDDLRLTNPASNEKLLNALASYLVDNKYDLKALMRLTLQSEAYQRSSAPLAENRGDGRMYSRYYPERLFAEVLLDAYSQVTASPTQFKDYPLGLRALQLPDSNVESYFLAAFGRPERISTCECERTVDPSMAQALHIANGDTVNKKLAKQGSRVEQLIKAGRSEGEIVEEAFLWSLARMPTEEEKGKLVALLKEAKKEEKRQAIEDLFWSLMSSNEFLFNH